MTFPTVPSTPILSGEAANTTVFSATMPTGIVAGDCLVAFAHSSYNRAWPTPTGWTEKATLTGNSSSEKVWVWAKVAVGSDVLEVDRTGLSGDVAVGVYRIGAWYGDISGVEASVNAQFDNPDPPSLTASWGSADNLWIIGGAGYGVALVFPTNYTSNQLNGDNGGNTERMQTATREAAAATENPNAFTTIGVGFSFAMTMVVRPSAGPSNLTYPNSDITDTGWTNSTGTNSFALIDEPTTPNDADYVTSPALGSNQPLVMGLTQSLAAGTYKIKLRAKYTVTSGQIKATLMDTDNTERGNTGWITLSASETTYQPTVVTSGTATRIKIEVQA